MDEQGRVLPRPGQRVGAPPADQQHAARVGGETRRDRAMWLHTVISCDQSAAMATRSSLPFGLRGNASRHAILCGCMKLRSEEHTSELQSLMRTSYAVFCLKKTKIYQTYARHIPSHQARIGQQQDHT